jgi:hypothetical protein
MSCLPSLAPFTLTRAHPRLLSDSRKQQSQTKVVLVPIPEIRRARGSAARRTLCRFDNSPPGKTFRVQGAPGYAFVVMEYAITAKGCAMLSALIGVLIIVVIGAICFWAIDKFAADRRLAQLLKLLVVLICIAAILQRVLPLLGVYI